MRLITISNILFQVSRRCMCSNNSANNLPGKDDQNQMSQHLKNYLNEESPLKNYENVNELTSHQTQYISSLKAEKDAAEKIDPESTSIIVFPGQGNQYVGMGKALLQHSVVEDMFDAASSILKYNLKKLCLEGPKKKLDQTEYCQPATLVCCLAAVEEMKLSYPLALSNCIATCGFSLGEIAALVFAGCISFENAVHITWVRAKAMQECSEMVPSGLATVLYGADSLLKEAMEEAKNECSSQGISDPVCDVANYLFPECKVLGGHDVALKYLEKNQSKYKLRRVLRLPVSGAFHTSLMKEAVKPFEKALRKVQIKEPLVPVLSNIRAKPYQDSFEIQRLLPKQLFTPVKWEQIVHYLYSRPQGVNFPHTYECGPGNSLSVILKRVNFPAYHNCHRISA